MITNLYFVRHAHSTYTPEELKRPLSEKGMKDAIKVKELLRGENIHHVVASPYLRAIQTVEGIAVILKKEIQIIDDFKERKLAKESVNNFEEAIEEVWDNPDFSWEGGESNKIAQQRGIKATKMILEKFKGKNVVIGTHGNIMVLIMNYFDEQYSYSFWKNLAMPDIYKLSFQANKLVHCTRIWNDSY